MPILQHEYFLDYFVYDNMAIMTQETTLLRHSKRPWFAPAPASVLVSLVASIT